VLLHTLFAAAVVTISFKTKYRLQIPNVMLTVLGVVIGFVISYRASSGYDRYWMGRTCWSDIIRDSRTMGRLIWFHVPPLLSAKTPEEIQSGTLNRTKQEMMQVMAEKRLALDLVEAFAFALKHHVRGELGIYFEDLYHLVRPLHDHEHPPAHTRKVHTATATTSALAPPRKAHRISTQPATPQAQPSPATPAAPLPEFLGDPVIPPVNAYGTFETPSRASSRHYLPHAHSSTSLRSQSSQSVHSQHQPLMPSTQPEHEGVMNKVSGDLIPFMSYFYLFRRKLMSGRSPDPSDSTAAEEDDEDGLQREWSGPVHSMKVGHSKRRPRVAGDGENLPLEIVRCLSEWYSVLEDRGTVAGTSLSLMITYLTNFEENLSALEKILTTPLPLVYAVHIKHTVWIYLFFLPFQLIGEFGWYTIPGVCIAAFIYLGFLAAGQEIEQPFAYDDNDLDLDLFCREIIHADVEHLRTSPCLNAYLGSSHPHPTRRKSMTVAEVSERLQEESEVTLSPTS